MEISNKKILDLVFHCDTEIRDLIKSFKYNLYLGNSQRSIIGDDGTIIKDNNIFNIERIIPLKIVNANSINFTAIQLESDEIHIPRIDVDFEYFDEFIIEIINNEAAIYIRFFNAKELIRDDKQYLFKFTL